MSSSSSSWTNRKFNVSRVGGVKIGTFDRSYKTNYTSGRGGGMGTGGTGGVKIGNVKPIITSGKEILPDIGPNNRKSNSDGNAVYQRNKQEVILFKLRLLLPYKSFGFREYNKATSSALNILKRGTTRKLDFFKRYDIETQIETLTMTPSPIIGPKGKNARE
ncbi:hypothetical protein Phum_PHUM390640 [Pediculus humanus corporis]|uniref:Uncharacterized protein n=1 Tax=Pediculus humanus subsp. corporis TaxID=121224 RepID=E0VR13_PEDHC|nr:uncharacterized protein Phum_PHUM390640 [Pediculus humanus corporis]EEB15819.1 hypothetical protein Phum_PHUM390640 [Pediculus humanus corporis]